MGLESVRWLLCFAPLQEIEGVPSLLQKYPRRGSLESEKFCLGAHGPFFIQLLGMKVQPARVFQRFHMLAVATQMHLSWPSRAAGLCARCTGKQLHGHFQLPGGGDILACCVNAWLSVRSRGTGQGEATYKWQESKDPKAGAELYFKRRTGPSAGEGGKLLITSLFLGFVWALFQFFHVSQPSVRLRKVLPEWGRSVASRQGA